MQGLDLRDARWDFAGVVCHEYQRHSVAADKEVDETADTLLVSGIKPVEWLIKNQQRRLFDECPGQKHETLFAGRKLLKPAVGDVAYVEKPQPCARLVKLIGCGLAELRSPPATISSTGRAERKYSCISGQT